MRLIYLLPVAFFAILVVIFAIALQSTDRDQVPSTLIGKVIKPFDLPGLDPNAPLSQDVPRLSDADLKSGDVVIVNFWASWCTPCRVEHPQLEVLSKRDDVRLIGLNYKDEESDARQFLEQLGNPFAAIGQDTTGRVGIDWGLTGVPETFVVDGEGRVIARHVGPITPTDIDTVFEPAIRGAR